MLSKTLVSDVVGSGLDGGKDPIANSGTQIGRLHEGGVVVVFLSSGSSISRGRIES